MKKIVAILLVIALMSAMFVVPAHAHEAEEASARASTCPRCGEWMEYRTNEYSRNYYDYPGCTNNAMTHKHYDVTYVRYYICTKSGCYNCENNVKISPTYYTTSNKCIYG